MIERLVFAPMAPLLNPDVSRGAASELDQLRAAIDAALTEAIAHAGSVIVLATDEATEVAQYLLSRVSPDTTIVRANLNEEPADATTLLVMGDGSAKRTEKAPGYINPQALEFDQSVSQIFESARLAELAKLDHDLANTLWVAGIEPWQEVGMWVERTASSWHRLTLHFEAPYGVGYFVASYSRQ